MWHREQLTPAPIGRPIGWLLSWLLLVAVVPGISCALRLNYFIVSDESFDPGFSLHPDWGDEALDRDSDARRENGLGQSLGNTSLKLTTDSRSAPYAIIDQFSDTGTKDVDLEDLMKKQPLLRHSANDEFLVPFDEVNDSSTGSHYFLSSVPQTQGKQDRALLQVNDELLRASLQRFRENRKIEAYQNGATWSPIGSGRQRPAVQRRPVLRHFRPHLVNTAKGLRNIPALLNDGELLHAPNNAPETGGGHATPRKPNQSIAEVSNTDRPAGTGAINILFNNFKWKLKAIYPGTVWCGDGNQAKSEDDIGFFYLTDSCCRAHDLCPITIAAGEQFNRLRNNGHFTRAHCDCDKQFYNCLKSANTLVSRQIGYTYFNLLKPRCFRFEHPKVNCTRRSKGKCLTYVVDEQQPKKWQWFDNLIF
ncbi:uncharacterized protein LOC128278160 [Anopheles cruzii]|uniref:uncharacterized protein LOC128278160 n=1 Tax=Anopheles cruzii TaxID=68878 RepID=UPI0022EC5BA9|nr:uncharacterized protein LOC128278160 [Anopheles cruzii]